MEFKVNREIFSTNEVAFDGSNEQAIELDYILPDYFPDIFRVLKCQLSPKVVSHSISGEKLTYELVVGIKVLYVSEQSNALRCIEQKVNYSKSVDLGKPVQKPTVALNPKMDYVNCRVVNQRRLDVRGAISTKVKVVCEKSQQLITDAFGGNIQLKKSFVTYPSSRLIASKRVTIVEELELGSSKPAIQAIVRSEAIAIQSDKKLIANKLISKGDVHINMLYTCEKDNVDSLEAMQFTIPFSQIIDVDGIDDRYDACVDVTAISCELIAKVNSGDNNEIECEIVLLMECRANKFESAELVEDAFSTSFPCEISVAEAKLEQKPIPINETHLAKASLEYREGDITCVYDAWSKVTSIVSHFDYENKIFKFLGTANFCVIGKNENGCPIYLESDVQFEHTLRVEDASKDSYAEPKAVVTSCSYNLTSTNTVEIRADIKIFGYLYESSNHKLISEITVNDSVQKERDGSYALKLYFADSDEDIWEIAKKYSTSINAIMEENELAEDKVSKRGMLLIPIIT